MTDFDYCSAIKTVLLQEGKAVAEFKEGSLKAWNYLFGKINNIPWGDYKFDDNRPVTIGHKIDPKEIGELIIYIINKPDSVN